MYRIVRIDMFDVKSVYADGYTDTEYWLAVRKANYLNRESSEEMFDDVYHVEYYDED